MAWHKSLSSNKINWKKVIHLLLRTLPLVPGPEIYELLKDLKSSRSNLHEKATRVASSLEEASQLVEELQSELKEKLEQGERLKSEYERYQKLATVEEKQAEALIQQMKETLGSNQIRERWIALGINLFAGLIVFFLGVWMSPWVNKILGIH